MQDALSTPSIPANSDAPTSPTNSLETLKLLSQAGKLTWRWPLIMSFIRFPLILLGIALMYLYFSATSGSNPLLEALLSSNVTMTFTADLACLLLLLWLTHREGLPLRTLFGQRRHHLALESLITVGLAISLIIVFFVATYLCNLLVGLLSPSYMQSLLNSSSSSTNANPYHFPLWYFWWGTLILPIGAAFAEELVYRAYALPRLRVLTHRPWLAALLVSLGFGLQHVAFSFSSWEAALARFLTTFLVGLFLGFLYLKMQRLWPLVIAHWFLDFAFLGLFPLLAVLHTTGH